MSVFAAQVPMEVGKKAAHSQRLKLQRELPYVYRCWELYSCPLEEQLVFFTAESFLIDFCFLITY